MSSELLEYVIVTGGVFQSIMVIVVWMRQNALIRRIERHEKRAEVRSAAFPPPRS